MEPSAFAGFLPPDSFRNSSVQCTEYPMGKCIQIVAVVGCSSICLCSLPSFSLGNGHLLVVIPSPNTPPPTDPNDKPPNIQPTHMPMRISGNIYDRRWGVRGFIMKGWGRGSLHSYRSVPEVMVFV